MSYRVTVTDAPEGDSVEILIEGTAGHSGPVTPAEAAALLKRAARQIEGNPSTLDRLRWAWDEFKGEIGIGRTIPGCYRCGGQHHTMVCRLPAGGTRVHSPGTSAPYQCRTCKASANSPCLGGFMLALPPPGATPHEG